LIRFLCGALRIFAALCVEMAVKRRDAKIRRRTAEKIHPKNSLFVQSPAWRRGGVAVLPHKSI